jgi:hypothetical protein
MQSITFSRIAFVTPVQKFVRFVAALDDQDKWNTAFYPGFAVKI